MDLNGPIEMSPKVRRKVRKTLEIWQKDFEKKLRALEKDGTLAAEGQL